MSWITVAIISYLLFSIVVLVDKRLLTSAIPNAKVYVFYVGMLGTLALFLVPFVGFYIPKDPIILVFGILAGFSFLYGLFWFYKGLSLFEASRMAPAVGGLTPLFTFAMIYFASSGGEKLLLPDVAAFLLLILGSVLIVSERNRFVNLGSLKISVVSAFFLSLSFVFSKYLFLAMPFWPGFIIKSMGGTLAAVCFFIIFPELKREIFKKNLPVGGQGEKPFSKTPVIFLANQSLGAGAAILQNWAIALAPLIYVAFINALQGVQYVFLLIFGVFLSIKAPHFLKEEVSRGVVAQKVAAILIISAGLIILALQK